ncbi:MAG: FkbM family methyltransferase [Planctomycetaceae bacterium]
MHWKRLPHLFDRTRWRNCRTLFDRPLRAFFDLSFVRRGLVSVSLKGGERSSFSRSGRDHRFWDWFLQRPVPLSFTGDGCLQIEYDGSTLSLRPGTTDFVVFEEVFLQDEYGVRNSTRTFETVIDLGANVGMFTCAMLPRARRVISVEAVAENHRQAVRNVTANRGREDDVLHCAVAARSGESIRIYRNPRNTGGHSTAPEWIRRSAAETAEPDFESVETISLADLFEARRLAFVDFLKCDIEGAEYGLFLNTPADVLARIGEIAMEVHVSPAHPPHLLYDLVARLRAAGFDLQLPREVHRTVRIDSFVITARNRLAAWRAA